MAAVSGELSAQPAHPPSTGCIGRYPAAFYDATPCSRHGIVRHVRQSKRRNHIVLLSCKIAFSLIQYNNNVMPLSVSPAKPVASAYMA